MSIIKKNILFLSYDGMTDNLGQSQVIPYLVGLSKKYTIHIISAEKSEVFELKKNTINDILGKNNILWHPINYTKKPPILSTIIDIYKIRKLTEKLHKKYNFSIIHCRSYITAFVGVNMKKKFGTKFLFDMRGFYPDERVDGNIWNLKNPMFNIVYKFFKKSEIKFLQSADYTISLTENAKQTICSWNDFKNKNIPIQVIPCCADTDFFNETNVNQELLSDFKSKNNLSENFIISYLGSVGTWYMLEEMLDFFQALINLKQNSKFLFITPDNKDIIIEKAKEKNIDISKLIILKSDRKDVPTYISVSNISLFFIKPVFSKKASSPTKLAELLSMGIPVISNSGYGDINEIFENSKIGYLIKNFTEKEYKSVCEKLLYSSDFNKDILKETSNNLFSLQSGIERYNKVYSYLIEK